MADQILNLNGKEYKVRPLSAALLRKHMAVMTKLAHDPPFDEALEALLQVIHAALKRDYPKITKRELEEGLDLNTLPTAIRMLMGLRGVA